MAMIPAMTTGMMDFMMSSGRITDMAAMPVPLFAVPYAAPNAEYERREFLLIQQFSSVGVKSSCMNDSWRQEGFMFNSNWTRYGFKWCYMRRVSAAHHTMEPCYIHQLQCFIIWLFSWLVPQILSFSRRFPLCSAVTSSFTDVLINCHQFTVYLCKQSERIYSSTITLQ